MLAPTESALLALPNKSVAKPVVPLPANVPEPTFAFKELSKLN